MTQTKHLIMTAILLSAMAWLLSACGTSEEDAAAEAARMAAVPEIPNFDGSQFDGPNLQRVREAGVLVLAYANEAPYGYRDSDTREVTGEAPEMARVVAKALGIDRVQGDQVEWDSLIPGLNSGRFDVIGAGMYIRPDRAANVAFTNPTYRIGEAFLVRSGNPKALHSYEDIAENEDSTIGVVRGTVERDYARNAGIPDDRVVIFNDNDSALAGVRSGQVDAFAGTALTVQTLVDRVADDAGVERADPFTQPTDADGNQVYGYGAFAFRQGEDDLVEAFNAALDAFIGSDAHRELVAPFGFAEEELPGGLTTQEVLDLQ